MVLRPHSGKLGRSRCERAARVGVRLDLCCVQRQVCARETLAIRPRRRSSRGLRRVQLSRRTDEPFEGLLVDAIALAEVDGAPQLALEAGVEEAGRIRQGGPLGESELHLVLVNLAGE